MNNGDSPIYPDPMRGSEQTFSNQEPHTLPIGLTKREYFSAMAMQGICSKPNDDKYHVNEGWLHAETVAQNAIKIADELLKQLEK